MTKPAPTGADRAFSRGDHVRHRDWRGVAFWVVGPETEERVIEPDWDTLRDDDGNPMDADVWWPEDDDFETVETGRLLVRMVGDDRDISADPDDLEPIDEDDYCSGCGQLGCGWGH